MNVKALLLGVGLLVSASASAALVTLSSGTLNTAIPDGNVNGLQSTLTFNDVDFNYVLDVNVRLNISGGYNGDLYVYLTHGSGFSILLNRAGRTGTDAFGYGDAGFNITLDDVAGTDIHNYGGNGGAALTGTWQPDARNVNPATVLNTDPRSAFLSAFNGLDPNGGWTLFVADVSGGDQSTLVSWELDITAVPEPTTVALGVFGGLLALGGGLRWWRRTRR
jgi:subtilisin-like proprotein convertase family protein